MPEYKNSDVVKHILQKLLDISGRKTTQSHAVITMSTLLDRLKDKHDFLKHIEIKNTRFLEDEDPISVMSDINTIKSNELGEALSEIIKTMNTALGKEAGHYFIKEFRTNIDDEYTTSIENMGIDLSILQLEFEINEMTKKL